MGDVIFMKEISIQKKNQQIKTVENIKNKIKITFCRERQIMPFNYIIDILIDGTKVAKLRNYQTIVVEVKPGKHDIVFQTSWGKFFGFTEINTEFTEDCMIIAMYNRFSLDIDASLYNKEAKLLKESKGKSTFGTLFNIGIAVFVILYVILYIMKNY